MEVEKILDQFSDSIIKDIEARFETTGASATKKTIRSLRKESTDESTKISGGGGFLESRVETGSPAGTLVPLGDLVEWCIARNIPIRKAGRIQRNIFKYGTRTVSKEHPRELFTEIINDKARRDKLYQDLQSPLIKSSSSEIVKMFKK